MGAIKDILGLGENKGVSCEDQEDGTKICRVAVRHRNNLLSTGTSFSYAMDNKCHAGLVKNSMILDDDTEAVNRALKRAEADCRGGIN